ncbi:MAG: thiamine phosphate synthase [Verrucomicrobia bacterium]|nr:thiamine phosphate synthase [Verrucomicrobiota bacterium]MBS0646698.1 thiamine phosphate synthase [Verrucomicrobiota bacterium]
MPITSSLSPLKPFYSQIGRPIYNLSLYLVTHPIDDNKEFVEKVKKAVQGGVTCVQYRDFKNDFPTRVRLASCLKDTLRSFGVPLMINSDLDLAKAIQAHGVYLENKEVSWQKARDVLGHQSVIGVPASTLEEVRTAEKWDIDYLSIKVFPSQTTSTSSQQTWGLEGLKTVRTISQHRLVAIGHIFGNLEAVLKTLQVSERGDGIAMIGDLWRAQDPRVTAQQIQTCVKK